MHAEQVAQIDLDDFLVAGRLILRVFLLLLAEQLAEHADGGNGQNDQREVVGGRQNKIYV